jgi:hypothetical protein
VNLALSNYGVDDAAAVIHANKPPDVHLSGSPVDLEDANVGIEGEGQVGAP